MSWPDWLSSELQDELFLLSHYCCAELVCFDVIASAVNPDLPVCAYRNFYWVSRVPSSYDVNLNISFSPFVPATLKPSSAL